jgi:general secretion pathway protein A
VDFTAVDTTLRARRGLCLITGSADERTELAQHIAEGGGRDTYVATLKAPIYCEEDLVERLLLTFGVVSSDDAHTRERAGISLEQLVDALHGFLLGLVQIEATAIMVLDDAHDLPEPVIECVGLLTDLEHRGVPLLQIVLAGSPQLRTLLERERFRALAERVVLAQDLTDQTSRLRRSRFSVGTAVVVALLASLIAAVGAAFLYQQLGF